MASNELTVVEVKHALEIAREAMELDAEELRLRGRAAASPDLASVGTLAAGILVANALGSEHAAEDDASSAKHVRRPSSSRVTTPA